ncbi:hypothetical protein [Halorussus lipolyticus]|uniref:hypothetical protein n=1 Tax=Halorussus lipolyticus TaxID=3034024 RepID=UPI0023E7E891|nr:hypothetical protein [Halorussus sp. DT80]
MSEKNGISRRSMLKSVGAAGFASVTFSSQEVTAALEANETIQISGKERKRTLKEAFQSSDFRKIRKEFKSNRYQGKKWKANKKEAVCTKVNRKNGKNYKFVLLPFETGGGEKLQANLLWFDREIEGTELPQVLGHVASREDKKSAETLMNSKSSTTSTSWRVEAYRVESGVVTTKEGSFDGGGTVSVNDNLSGGGGGCSQCCLVETVTCNSWDWSCMLQIAGSVVGSVTACAACAADPTKLSCGLCLLALSAGASTTADCATDGNVLMDDCQKDTIWVTADDFEKKYLTYPYDCKYDQ